MTETPRTNRLGVVRDGAETGTERSAERRGHGDAPPSAPSAQPPHAGPSGSDRPVPPARTLDAELIVGTVAVDASIREYQGVPLESVTVRDRGPLNRIPTHPAFIEAARATITPPDPNRPKAHLVDWHPPVLNQGSVVGLEIARSDYLTTLATHATLERLHDEISAGEREFGLIPKRLDVHLVVVCGGDDTVLLTRRGGHVNTEPHTWMVSVGESMDWEHDTVDGVPRPEATAVRCLSAIDELHLPPPIARTAEFTLVAIATEWTAMLINLVVVATLPELTCEIAQEHFRRGENIQLDAVPFTPEACLPLVRSGVFASSRPRSVDYPVSDISRASLYAALRHQYPDAAWKAVQP